MGFGRRVEKAGSLIEAVLEGQRGVVVVVVVVVV